MNKRIPTRPSIPFCAEPNHYAGLAYEQAIEKLRMFTETTPPGCMVTIPVIVANVLLRGPCTNA